MHCVCDNTREELQDEFQIMLCKLEIMKRSAVSVGGDSRLRFGPLVDKQSCILCVLTALITV